jgi:hypothetical protein
MRLDIFTDHPDCVPGPESRALTLAILAGIEAEQQKEIDQLDQQTIRHYSIAMSEASTILKERDPEMYPDNGEELLRQLRAEWPRQR